MKDKRESAYKAHFRSKSVTEDKENVEVTVVNIILQCQLLKHKASTWKTETSAELSPTLSLYCNDFLFLILTDTHASQAVTEFRGT